MGCALVGFGIVVIVQFQFQFDRSRVERQVGTCKLQCGFGMRRHRERLAFDRPADALIYASVGVMMKSGDLWSRLLIAL